WVECAQFDSRPQPNGVSRMNYIPIRVHKLPVETEEMYGAFSPDRLRLLTGGDGTAPKVQIWDVETGNCLHTLYGHKGPVPAVAWTTDQRLIGSGGFDGCICCLWDAGSGECLRVLDDRRSYVRSVEFSRSGEQLLSGSGDGVVRLWDVATGKLLQS